MDLEELKKAIKECKRRHFLYQEDELKEAFRTPHTIVYQLDGYFFQYVDGKFDCCWTDDDDTRITFEEWLDLISDEEQASIIEAEERNERMFTRWENALKGNRGVNKCRED